MDVGHAASDDALSSDVRQRRIEDVKWQRVDHCLHILHLILPCFGIADYI